MVGIKWESAQEVPDTQLRLLLLYLQLGKRKLGGSSGSTGCIWRQIKGGQPSWWVGWVYLQRTITGHFLFKKNPGSDWKGKAVRTCSSLGIFTALYRSHTSLPLPPVWTWAMMLLWAPVGTTSWCWVLETRVPAPPSFSSEDVSWSSPEVLALLSETQRTLGWVPGDKDRLGWATASVPYPGDRSFLKCSSGWCPAARQRFLLPPPVSSQFSRRTVVGCKSPQQQPAPWGRQRGPHIIDLLSLFKLIDLPCWPLFPERERRDLHPKQGAGPKFLSGFFFFFSFKGGAAYQPEATPSQSSSSNYSVPLLACTWLEPSSLIWPSARLPTQWRSHFSISTIITFLISVSTTIYGAVTMCQAPCSKLSYVISFRPGSNSKRRWLFYRQDELLDLAHPPGRQDLNVSLFDFPIWALNFPISHPVLWLPADAYVP